MFHCLNYKSYNDQILSVTKITSCDSHLRRSRKISQKPEDNFLPMGLLYLLETEGGNFLNNNAAIYGNLLEGPIMAEDSGVSLDQQMEPTLYYLRYQFHMEIFIITVQKA